MMTARGHVNSRKRVPHAVLLLLLAAVSIDAARAQDKSHEHASPNVSQLIQELKSPDLQHRRDAARELMMIEPLPSDAIQALADALKSAEKNDAEQRYAIMALAKAGAPAIPALAALTKSPRTYEPALEALGRMASHEPAVWPILIGTFAEDTGPFGEDADLQVAAYELANAGPPVVPLLRKALVDKHPRTRKGAAKTFAQMVFDYRTWKNSNPDARRQAGVALAETADLAPAVSELAAALKDPDSGIRHPAAIALAHADPSDKRAVPVLAETLTDNDMFARQSAVAALEEMGSNAQEAVPALEHSLTGDRDWGTRAGAVAALARIGGAKACPDLAQAIAAQKDRNVRFVAARAMVALWPACSQTIQVLSATLGNEESPAEDQLAQLGKPAVPALAEALKSPDLDVRKDAVSALAQMKPLPAEAVQALMLALKDKSLDVRSAAATALQDAGGEAERAALDEQKREEEIYAQQSKPDTRRYSREELAAEIPADEDHKYPLTLVYLFPLGGSVEKPQFLITLHTGKYRPERLAVWKRVGNDQYQKEKVMESEDPAFAQQHFETPITFRAKVRVIGHGRRYGETELFVDIPVDAWRSHLDQVFAVDSDGLHPVEIESATNWYTSKLGPRESVWYSAGNSSGDDRLEFDFPVWNADDPMCCPTAGEVVGTYRIVKSLSPEAAPGAPAGLNARKAGEFAASPTPSSAIMWRMLVDTAQRKPESGPAAPSKKSEVAPKPSGG